MAHFVGHDVTESGRGHPGHHLDALHSTHAAQPSLLHDRLTDKAFARSRTKDAWLDEFHTYLVGEANTVRMQQGPNGADHGTHVHLTIDGPFRAPGTSTPAVRKNDLGAHSRSTGDGRATPAPPTVSAFLTNLLVKVVYKPRKPKTSTANDA